MTHVILKAYFPIPPSELQKQAVEKRLISLVLDADPLTRYTLCEKEGSWEIAVMVWSGEKLAEWIFGKTLDELTEVAKNKVLQWREEKPSTSAPRLSSSDSNTSSTDVMPLSVSSLPTTCDEAISALCHKSNTLLEELAPNGENVRVVFGVYREGYGGQVFTATRQENTKDFSLVVTDSQRDFELRTGFDLKQ